MKNIKLVQGDSKIDVIEVSVVGISEKMLMSKDGELFVLLKDDPDEYYDIPKVLTIKM